jgi:hypothetical protein
MREDRGSLSWFSTAVSACRTGFQPALGTDEVKSGLGSIDLL